METLPKPPCVLSSLPELLKLSSRLHRSHWVLFCILIRPCRWVKRLRVKRLAAQPARGRGARSCGRAGSAGLLFRAALSHGCLLTSGCEMQQVGRERRILGMDWDSRRGNPLCSPLNGAGRTAWGDFSFVSGACRCADGTVDGLSLPWVGKAPAAAQEELRRLRAWS